MKLPTTDKKRDKKINKSKRNKIIQFGSSHHRRSFQDCRPPIRFDSDAVVRHISPDRLLAVRCSHP